MSNYVTLDSTPKKWGLAKDVYEKDCTKPGTNEHGNLAFCDEHYQLVVVKS